MSAAITDRNVGFFFFLIHSSAEAGQPRSAFHLDCRAGIKANQIKGIIGKYKVDGKYTTQGGA